MHFIYSCHARHGRTEVGIRNVVGTQLAKGRTSMRSSALCLSHPRSSGAASTTGRLPYFQGRSESAMEACSMRCIASGARPPDLSLRGGRRPTWQSRGTCRIIGKPSAKSQLPSRDCTPRALPRASRSGRHGPFGASQWHVRRVQRYTSALLPLNCPPQGGHYPQGARRIRKAAKPPTAAQ